MGAYEHLTEDEKCEMLELEKIQLDPDECANYIKNKEMMKEEENRKKTAAGGGAHDGREQK